MITLNKRLLMTTALFFALFGCNQEKVEAVSESAIEETKNMAADVKDAGQEMVDEAKEAGTEAMDKMAEAGHETMDKMTDAKDTMAEAPVENIIAIVNGESITMDDFTSATESRLRANPNGNNSPELVFDEVINREILRQAAVESGIDKDPAVQAEIANAVNGILVGRLINKQVEAVDVSDAALKAEYDEQIKGINDKEYKARHILLEDEETAKAVIEEINAGADFAAVATEKSTGPSATSGGDLGWFQAESMVPEFSEALKTMEKDAVSATPVKTQFGWHVIKLEDTRAMTPPVFEESKQNLQSLVINRTVQKYVTDLRDAAKVEYVDETFKPAEAAEVTESEDTAEPMVEEKPAS